MLENVGVTSYKDYLDMFADLKQDSKDSPPDLAIQIVWERKEKKGVRWGVDPLLMAKTTMKQQTAS